MTEQEIRDLFQNKSVPLDRDDVWSVQAARVVKHKALERLAAALDISYDAPQLLRCERDEAVILVTGKLPGGRSEWSIGEALATDGSRPGNYKVSGKQAPYVYAMAEKRAKDRVILKLAGLHGAYSEDEADDFKQPAPVQAIPAKPAVSPASLFIAALNHSANEDDLSSWYEKNSEAIAALDDGYQAEVREAYRVKLRTLRQQQRAA